MAKKKGIIDLAKEALFPDHATVIKNEHEKAERLQAKLKTKKLEDQIWSLDQRKKPKSDGKKDSVDSLFPGWTG